MNVKHRRGLHYLLKSLQAAVWRSFNFNGLNVPFVSWTSHSFHSLIAFVQRASVVSFVCKSLFFGTEEKWVCWKSIQVPPVDDLLRSLQKEKYGRARDAAASSFRWKPVKYWWMETRWSKSAFPDWLVWIPNGVLLSCRCSPLAGEKTSGLVTRCTPRKSALMPFHTTVL